MTAIDSSSLLDTPDALLVRGMRDLLPAELARLRRVERAFLEACRAWGYSEVRTPTLEHLYLFTSSGTLTPQALTSVYSFLDWDGWTGERVVLRPEATIPVARLFRESLRTPTAKLAYIANNFRFHAGDEPREVWQCGAELIGAEWPAGDVEALALPLGVLRALKIGDVRVEIAHAGVARALLEHAGFTLEEIAELYDRLLDGSTTLIDEVGGRLPQLLPALTLLDRPAGGEGYIANLRAVFAGVPALAAPLDELTTLAAAARTLEIEPHVVPAAQRDFEYYTGPVFRLLAGGQVLGSGGRYDRLVTSSDGNAVAACGFALAIDRIAPLLREERESAPGFVRVRPADESGAGYAQAARAAAALQSLGVAAGLTPGGPAARWTLTVGDAPPYRLAGRSAGSGIETASLEDVAATVRGLQS
jgi:histidyl-tRNA synthetase